MTKNRIPPLNIVVVLVVMAVIFIMFTRTVLASEGATPTQAGVATASIDEEIDAIAITVIVPPAPSRQPINEPRRLFPINVAEGYNYEGVRELVRVYELLPNENPEWINTDSFVRNGYYYQLAEITRRVDVAHTVREHSEVVEVASNTNDLATVIAGLVPTMDFVDEDGYVGLLHLDIHSIAMNQDGTRSTSRTVSQLREFPHLATPDLALIPQTITANGRTYTLADVEWRAATSNPIDFNSVAQTFTAFATYTRTATSTVSTGYTTTASYSGTLTRVSAGETRFVATFIGTPIASASIAPPLATKENEEPRKDEGSVYVAESLLNIPVYTPISQAPQAPTPTEPVIINVQDGGFPVGVLMLMILLATLPLWLVLAMFVFLYFKLRQGTAQLRNLNPVHYLSEAKEEEITINCGGGEDE